MNERQFGKNVTAAVMEVIKGNGLVYIRLVYKIPVFSLPFPALCRNAISLSTDTIKTIYKK